MPSAMVTFNGRITLPTDIRKQLGLKTGDKVEFVEIGNGRFAICPRTDAVDSTAGVEEVEERVPAMANRVSQTVQ